MKTLVLATLALLVSACAVSEANDDSKSNWLRACSASSDCGSALSCQCGVCTRACDEAASCAGPASACADPSAGALAEACGNELDPSPTDEGVCLRACERSADCGDAQRCVQGNCVGLSQPSPGDGAVPGDVRDGGRPRPPIDDSGTPRDAQPPMIADSAVPPVDAGDGGAFFVCASEERACCEDTDLSCEQGLVCHIDTSCIVAGESDERGVATLQTFLEQTGGVPLAADDAFVYGVHHREGAADQVVRWSIRGGAPEVLADGLFLVGNRHTPTPMVLDGDVLYFVAARSANDLSASVLRMSSDGSTDPEASGTAGSLLVQGATHLYFTNDGDSRVIALPKASFGDSAARVVAHVSSLDAPGSITALAINSTKLFVAESQVVGDGIFTLHTVDLPTGTAARLASNERFTVGEVARIYASDRFLIVRGQPAVDSLELASGEVIPLDLAGDSCAFDDEQLFCSYLNVVEKVDLAANQRAVLLTGVSGAFSFGNALVTDTSLYGVTSVRRRKGAFITDSLIRIDR